MCSPCCEPCCVEQQMSVLLQASHFWAEDGGLCSITTSLSTACLLLNCTEVRVTVTTKYNIGFIHGMLLITKTATVSVIWV